MRHGEAGNREMLLKGDPERRLTEAGKQEVLEIAISLKSLKLSFDCIGSSPLVRALETAKIMARTFKRSKRLEIWDELSPEGQRTDLYDRLSKMKDDSKILIVGHEPYLSDLIGDLITNKEGSRVALKKAGVAKVAVDSLIPKASGELKWLLTPKQIKKIS